MRKFHKYQGAGNDFIFFEDLRDSFPKKKIPFLCQRGQGIGADGLILVQKSAIADAKMVYFNADGEQAALCGNGMRCFVRYLRDQGLVKEQYTLEVMGKILTATLRGETIFTALAPTRILHWNLALPKLLGSLYVVDTGVPHAVLFAKEGVDVLQEGRQIRFDPRLAPQGANVNFVEVIDEHTLKVRTYERGVENETLSCGTGAGAASFVANRLGYCKEEVEVITKSKERLQVLVKSPLEVGGPSTKVFEGAIVLV